MAEGRKPLLRGRSFRKFPPMPNLMESHKELSEVFGDEEPDLEDLSPTTIKRLEHRRIVFGGDSHGGPWFRELVRDTNATEPPARFRPYGVFSSPLSYPLSCYLSLSLFLVCLPSCPLSLPLLLCITSFVLRHRNVPTGNPKRRCHPKHKSVGHRTAVYTCTSVICSKA